MSTQGAQEFIEQANQNPVIRKAARERYADIAGVGSDHGFDFTRDEFDQVMRERKASGGQGSGGSTTCQCGTGAEEGVTCQCGTDTGGSSTTCQCGGEQSEEDPETPTSDTVCQCGSGDGGGTTCQCGS